jgi:hypothetical protein
MPALTVERGIVGQSEARRLGACTAGCDVGASATASQVAMARRALLSPPGP